MIDERVDGGARKVRAGPGGRRGAPSRPTRMGTRSPLGLLEGVFPVGVLLTGALLVGLVASPEPVVAQTPTLTDVRLSADSVSLGDLFELTFTVTVPDGVVAFLPDSLTAAGFESFGPVRWSREPAADGRVDLDVRYELIAFQVGVVEVPDFIIFTARGDESTPAGLSDPGDIVGDWSAFRAEPAAVPSARPLAVPANSLWVRSVLLVDEGTGMIAPRPAADVVGRSRHWAATLLGLLFATAFAWSTWMMVRERLAARSARARDRRTVALEALDALLADGAHRAGRMQGFYTRSSEIVRRYVEGMDLRWSPAWTSTELMHDLGARRRDPSVGPLSAEMDAAETVKFGGSRPGPDVAEEHWRTVRSWIESDAEPTEDAR